MINHSNSHLQHPLLETSFCSPVQAPQCKTGSLGHTCIREHLQRTHTWKASLALLPFTAIYLWIVLKLESNGCDKHTRMFDSWIRQFRSSSLLHPMQQHVPTVTKTVEHSPCIHNQQKENCIHKMCKSSTTWASLILHGHPLVSPTTSLALISRRTGSMVSFDTFPPSKRTPMLGVLPPCLPFSQHGCSPTG